MKRYFILIGLVCLTALVSCEPDIEVDDPTGTTTEQTDPEVSDPDTIPATAFSDNLAIVWDGSSATVSGNVQGVTVANSNGYVVITSTADSVRYTLSGNGNGQFKLYSDKAYKLCLAGLTLTCSDGPAINSQCKKKGYVELTNANTLTDGSAYATSEEDQKAAIFSEGQLIISGTGTLNVTGNYKHALASDDYIRINAGVLNITAKVSDGIHVNDGLYINGGTITINAAGDGLQSDSVTIAITDGTVNITSVDKGILSQTGTLTVSGGTITVNTTGSEGKGIKSEGAMSFSGGKTTVICTGSSSSSWTSAWGPGGGGGGHGPGGW